MSGYDATGRRYSARHASKSPMPLRSSKLQNDDESNGSITEKYVTPTNVLFFVPNLIGYVRVFCTLYSFLLMVRYPDCWVLATTLYTTSFIGDLFDGIAARKLHQSSVFGGLLDMITDRCSTLGLLFMLYGEYGCGSANLNEDISAFFRMIFLSLAMLDISSHWCQMYATSSLKLHHKSTSANANSNLLVRHYYSNQLLFGYCCIAAEFMYIALYVRYHVHDYDTIPFLKECVEMVLKLCIPGWSIKQIINVFQLSSSCYAVASHDASVRNKGKINSFGGVSLKTPSKSK